MLKEVHNIECLHADDAAVSMIVLIGERLNVRATILLEVAD
jgi:hypothetical protein